MNEQLLNCLTPYSKSSFQKFKKPYGAFAAPPPYTSEGKLL